MKTLEKKTNDDSHLAVVESRRAVKRNPDQTYGELAKGIGRIRSTKIAAGVGVEPTPESSPSES